MLLTVPVMVVSFYRLLPAVIGETIDIWSLTAEFQDYFPTNQVDANTFALKAVRKVCLLFEQSLVRKGTLLECDSVNMLCSFSHC